MELFALGLNQQTKEFIAPEEEGHLTTGRVIAEHKERYVVATESGELNAELLGNLRFTARSRADFPAVGDWVGCLQYDDQSAIIHKILPRKNSLERRAVGKTGEKQIIAAHIDVAYIVQEIQQNFSLNRLERYLSICYDSGIEPVFIVTKTDLVSTKHIQQLKSELDKRKKGIKTIWLSNVTEVGISEVSEMIVPGNTYCFLGSSGVGKSTLINRIAGNEIMQTGAISDSTSKGKHTTSHRQLIVLPGRGVVIDTPGMRELGLTENTQGINTVFDEVIAMAGDCRYADCTHTNEEGCAVKEAVANGKIDPDTYSNYLKIKREQEHFQSTLAEKRKKDKEFGKMVKDAVKYRKRDKF